MTIKLFAYLAEAIAPEIQLDLPSTLDKATLLAAVATAYPLYRSDIESCLVAVDQEFVEGPFTVAATTEIALIPPVSGG
ncbi:MoaD/ThiS family protein [Enterococcus canis]|uniref:MoaD/ThiS family protein n=1 Tax=Enterococcus canis TaxID=214095 RepID=UPI00082DF1AE|nr:MoaD/ThiS family protein [Enterococcus canis]